MTQANFSETKLLEKIKNLSIDYQQLVEDFVEMLSQKQQKNKLLEEKPISISSQQDDDKSHGYGSWAGDIIMSDDDDEMLPKKEDDQLYGYGSLAGKIMMSEDFEEPLEDLAEYM